MRAYSAIALLSLVVACQAPPPEITDADRAQIEAEARQAIEETLEAYQATTGPDMDVETWLSFFTEDARLLGPGTDMRGSDLEGYIRGFLESGAQVASLDIEPFEISVHGDVALQIGLYDEKYLFPDGNRVVVEGYVFQKWLRQPDGTWKIHRTLFAPREAPPEG